MLMWVAVWVKEAFCRSLGVFEAVDVSIAQTEPIAQTKLSQRPPVSAMEERQWLKPPLIVQHPDCLRPEVLQKLGSM